ncbi:hypothetical protein JG536_10275 [Burkholderia ambifaria]|uniref:hypothetical protein n=1 Tax=Burkholderia ambifaria TaxID=152480 RepID=UPI001588F453|nr:hypothetical protein [Burkholderia ambifaria]QQJ96017.1 hypothetical protein JG536_10275 [Burkholderia ambifaria]
MNDRIDWEAPIEPGEAMLGLRLGLSIDAVRTLIGCDSETCQQVTQFRNSPRLLVDCLPGVVLFHAADMEDVECDWQNVLARLVFQQGVLKNIIVESIAGAAGFSYKGRILNKVGLGEKVARLLEFGSIKFDDAEEVFYSDNLRGMEVAGDDSCDLSVNKNQIVTYIKIF